MDKSWMDLPRSSNAYRDGLKNFLDFAFSNSTDERIICPCKKCGNGLCKKRNIVEGHLLWNGFLKGYTKWILHGELSSNRASYEYDCRSTSNDAKRDSGEGNEDDEERDVDSMDDKSSRMDLFGKTGKCFTKNGETSNHIVAKTWQKMQEKKSELPPIARDDGPNDVFAQVNGKGKRGRVGMYDNGVTTSNIYGDIPSGGKSSRMRMSYKKYIDELNQIVLEQSRQIQELIKINKLLLETHNSPPEANRVPSSSSSQYHAASSMHKMPLQVGAKVYLKSVFDSSKTVGIGCLQSLDPSQRIGQVQLGENWCEISINVAVEKDEDLIRPTSHFKTIGDAIGEVVAWPKNLVAMD